MPNAFNDVARVRIYIGSESMFVYACSLNWKEKRQLVHRLQCFDGLEDERGEMKNNWEKSLEKFNDFSLLLFYTHTSYIVFYVEWLFSFSLKRRKREVKLEIVCAKENLKSINKKRKSHFLLWYKIKNGIVKIVIIKRNL